MNPREFHLLFLFVSIVGLIVLGMVMGEVIRMIVSVFGGER